MSDRTTSDGYVYLIINRHFPGWVKVGQTNDPARRLRSYQTGDPTRSYQIAHCVPVRDPPAVEFYAHERLTRLGFTRSGEWFEVGLTMAVRVIERAIKEASDFSSVSAQHNNDEDLIEG